MRGGDQHGGKADQGVKGSDELRHRRHRDPPRGDDPDHGADRDGDGDLGEADHVEDVRSRVARRVVDQRRDTAIAMPSMPSRLPRRELSGLASPRSARMNSDPAIR
jgi:hypothetical protein